MEAAENLRFADYIMLSFAPQIFLTAMVYDGVFELFPNCAAASSNRAPAGRRSSCGNWTWASRASSGPTPILKAMPLTPSEYIRRAVKFTPFPGEDVAG